MNLKILAGEMKRIAKRHPGMTQGAIWHMSGLFLLHLNLRVHEVYGGWCLVVSQEVGLSEADEIGVRMGFEIPDDVVRNPEAGQLRDKEWHIINFAWNDGSSSG